MSNTSKTGVKHAKKTANSSSEPMVTEYGIRKISNCNFSKIIAIPKNALLNFGGENINQVDVKLVQQDGEKFLKLTPIAEKKKGVVSN